LCHGGKKNYFQDFKLKHNKLVK